MIGEDFIKKQELRSTIKRLSGPLWRGSAFLAIVVIFSSMSPYFLTKSNWLNTTLYGTDTLILALGMTFVIITGGIDLSVGAMLGISSSVTAVYLSHHHQGWGSVAIAVLLAVACSTLFGCLNVFIIVKMKIIPLIATLGTLGIGTGLTYLITGGASIMAPPPFENFGSAVWFGFLPAPTVVVIILYLFFGYLMTQTRFGLWTYAIGSNREAARRTGIPVGKQIFRVYVLSGFLAGIAGVLLVSRLSVGTPDAGQNVELDAIAAVVIGGASLFGGSGSLIGSLIGSAIVTILVTGLVLVGVQPYWQTIVVGAVIILSVYIQDFVRHQAIE